MILVSELRDLREKNSEERHLDDERSARGFDRDLNERDEKDVHNFHDDDDRDQHENDEDADSEDSDDMR